MGANLPAGFLHASASRGVGAADQGGRGWSTDEKAVRFLLNGLRRWQPKSREEPER